MKDARVRETNPEIAELVAKYKMRRAGARPALVDYTRDIWRRRHFTTTFSTANNAVGYSDSFLGQAWQLLTPLLNVAVYYLIFDVLLSVNKHIPNYIAFLVIGIFDFTFIQTAMLGGARSISANLSLTRVLHFPRAVLPISSAIISLQRLLFSFVILIPIVLLTGEPLTWEWLTLVPALALQSMFCLGLTFIMARVGAKIPDTSQVLPFILRTWLYVSGTLFSIEQYSKGKSHLLRIILEANPASVYMTLVRKALLSDPAGDPPYQWPLAIFWAVVTLIVGYIYFWRAEEQYGRV